MILPLPPSNRRILFLVCGGIYNSMSQISAFVAAQKAGWEVWVHATMEPHRCVHQLFPLLGLHTATLPRHAGMDFGIVTSGSLLDDVFQQYAAKWKAARVVPPRPAPERHGPTMFDTLNVLSDCGIEWQVPVAPLAHLIPDAGRQYIGVICSFAADTIRQTFNRWGELLPQLPQPLMVLGRAHGGSFPAQDCSGQTPSLPHLLPLFGMCRAIVTTHLGMAHVATACGVPTVTIMSATEHEGRTDAPIGPVAMTVRADAPLDAMVWAIRQAAALHPVGRYAL